MCAFNNHIQVEVNFQHFTEKKKKKLKNFPSAALHRVADNFWKEKHITVVYGEHLLQLIGNAIRQCTRGLNIGHNHNKA